VLQLNQEMSTDAKDFKDSTKYCVLQDTKCYCFK